MENMLCCHDLENTTLGGNTKPSNMIHKKWKKLNKRTICKIRQWVDNSVFNHVACENNAHVLWSAL